MSVDVAEVAKVAKVAGVTEVAGGADVADAVADAGLAGELLALIERDSRAIAALIGARAGDRTRRSRAREALARAFAVENDDRDGQLASLVALARAMRELGHGALNAAWPIKALWVRRPMPPYFMAPRAGSGAARLGDAVFARFQLPQALSDARLDWFEQRCRVAAPGLLRTHKQNAGDGEKLIGGEAELVRKRGRSPFS